MPGRPGHVSQEMIQRAYNLLLVSFAGYQIDGNSVHAITQKYGELYVQRAPGPKRHLVSAEDDVLYYAGEGTDYFDVVKGADGRVTAVEFFSDGMAPPRIEKRTSDAR